MFRLDAASGQQNKDAVLPHFIVKFLRIDSPIGILVEKFLSLNFLHSLVATYVGVEVMPLVLDGDAFDVDLAAVEEAPSVVVKKSFQDPLSPLGEKNAVSCRPS